MPPVCWTPIMKLLCRLRSLRRQDFSTILAVHRTLPLLRSLHSEKTCRFRSNTTEMIIKSPQNLMPIISLWEYSLSVTEGLLSLQETSIIMKVLKQHSPKNLDMWIYSLWATTDIMVPTHTVMLPVCLRRSWSVPENAAVSPMIPAQQALTALWTLCL